MKIKYRYTITKPNKPIVSEIFTLKQIESGEALNFIQRHNPREMDIMKERYIRIKDYSNPDVYPEGREIFEGDAVCIAGDADFKKCDGWLVSLDEPSYITLVDPVSGDRIPYFSFEYHGTMRLWEV